MKATKEYESCQGNPGFQITSGTFRDSLFPVASLSCFCPLHPAWQNLKQHSNPTH